MNRFFCLTALMFVLAHISMAQTFHVVDGKVIDASTQEIIPFVSIGIKGYPYGTSSNAEGSFSLHVPSVMKSSFTLTISCIGYESAEIKDPQSPITISLRPSTIQLKEVLVFSNDLRPEKIVKRAFSSIRKNYNTKPFLYKTFYRHYCNDNGVYGRLIEGAIDIYKTKGYRIQQTAPGQKDQVRVTQLRRSYDNSKIKGTHLPIALYSVMAADPVGFQLNALKGSLFALFSVHEVSAIRRRMDLYSFTLEGITEYDGEEVYVIKYKLKSDSIPSQTGMQFLASQSGTLFINTKDNAILKSEWSRYSVIDTVKTFSIYKKFKDKYYLQYTMKEGQNYRKKDNYKHSYHLELMTSEIAINDFQKFKGKEPDRETLLKINYDSTFWNTYNILKATPLEESIAADLQRDQPLKDQYADFVTQERDRYFGGKEDEEKFNEYLKLMRGNRPVYIDLWASWCGPCIREMDSSKELFEKYRSRIAFVYVSIDHDIDAWRKMIKRLGLEQMAMKHFRVGPDGDVMKTFDISSIPRYILVDRNGNFVNLNAPRPSDPKLIKEFERLIGEQN
jgi:thiol-disulfide isomerase/thioredoxin